MSIESQIEIFFQFLSKKQYFENDFENTKKKKILLHGVVKYILLERKTCSVSMEGVFSSKNFEKSCIVFSVAMLTHTDIFATKSSNFLGQNLPYLD